VVSARDSIGSLIAVTDAAIASPDAGSSYGRFGATLDLHGYQGQLQLEVAAKADPSAPMVRRVLRAGTVAPAASGSASSSLAISVFFSKGAPLDCSVVQGVPRTIDPAKNAYREALAALLAGPTADEKAGGYTTSIPTAAKVRSVSVNAAGTVTVDFDEGIQRGVAGSCRVGAIRAQVERTLRQFPEVRDVVISVRGDTETVLQP
jgi:spore germination protein GerM